MPEKGEIISLDNLGWIIVLLSFRKKFLDFSLVLSWLSSRSRSNSAIGWSKIWLWSKHVKATKKGLTGYNSICTFVVCHKEVRRVMIAGILKGRVPCLMQLCFIIKESHSGIRIRMYGVEKMQHKILIWGWK